MPAYGHTLLPEAIVTIAPHPPGEPLLWGNLPPARWTLVPDLGVAKSRAAAPEYPPNVILDHPLQAMLLATMVAASLGVLARRSQPAIQRGLTAFDPPPTTRT